LAEDGKNKPTEILNQRALEVVERIKRKLVGKDFKETENLNHTEQVNQLIRQATSHENICQAYLGWCPFWWVNSSSLLKKLWIKSKNKWKKNNVVYMFRSI